ncbi:MAG: S8 family peptidase [Steroidobacteraceae bacterium]
MKSPHPLANVATRCSIWAAALACLSLFLSPSAWSASEAQARIIVKWKTDATRTRAQAVASARTEFRQATGLAINPRRNLSERLDVMELERPVDQAKFTQMLNKLRAQPDVEYAVPDERRHPAVLPSDQYITAKSGHSGQWYLLNTEPASINAYAAWDYSQGGSSGNGIVVAVVDTGVRFDHPDLAAKLLPGYDFVDCDQTSCTGSGKTYLTANDGNGWDADASDPGDWVDSTDQENTLFADCDTGASSWHGTRVAGIVGAATNNGIGIAGTGWNARILPVRVLGKCGGYDSDIIVGMRWAAGLAVNGAPTNPNPAKVINLSLGGNGSCSQAYADVITTLNSMGVSVVASAGNDSAIINTPANCSGVIAVTGVRNTGTKVGFSSLGTAATIAAPAGNCFNSSGPCLYSLDTTTNLGATVPGVNDYTDQTNYNLGTSFSAPIVSGTIALMLGANGNLTPAQISSTLRSTATPFPQTAANTCEVPTGSTSVVVNEAECNCTTSTCGAGIVNAYQAVLAVSTSSSSSSSSSSNSSSAASSSNSTANATASASSAAATAESSGGSGGGGELGYVNLLLLAGLLAIRKTRKAC